MRRLVLIFAVALGFAAASMAQAIPVQKVQKLELESVTTSDAPEFAAFDGMSLWRVLNPNAFAVDVRLALLASGKFTLGTAAAGESYFALPYQAGKNRTRLLWTDGKGRTRSRKAIPQAHFTYVAAAAPPQVPMPGAFVLLMTGVGALAFVRRCQPTRAA